MDAWPPEGSRIAVAHGDTLELVDPDGSNRATLWRQIHPIGRGGVSEATWSLGGSPIARHALARRRGPDHVEWRDRRGEGSLYHRSGRVRSDPRPRPASRNRNVRPRLVA